LASPVAEYVASDAGIVCVVAERSRLTQCSAVIHRNVESLALPAILVDATAIVTEIDVGIFGESNASPEH
jgi:hypothetical protein